MISIVPRWLAAALHATLAVAAWLLASTAVAGEYSVSPVRVYLDRGAQSGNVAIRNLGADAMDFQVDVREWTVDADGKDRFGDAPDIVFFPKILRIEPNEERVIRIGTKAIPASTERAYRLFIEPIQPRTSAPTAPGASIAVVVRFALPVFVAPPQGQVKGEIANVAFERGSASATLNNTGTQHFRMDDGVVFTGRDAAGATIFQQSVQERYVLAGAARRVSVAVPKATCEKLATIEVSARSEAFALSRSLPVARAACE